MPKRVEKNRNLEKYKLVDHEKNEITVYELIDRYLYDPWTCFTNEEYIAQEQARQLCILGYHPVRNNYFSPPVWRRDLIGIQNNVIEESSDGNYVCAYCRVTGYDISYYNEELLQRHHVNKHKGWSMYSQLDLEKFEAEYKAKKAVNEHWKHA
jgi:hypothetical protein